MKKLVLMFLMAVGMILAGVGCAITAPSTTTIKTLDHQTGVTTETVTSESAFKSFLESTKNKVVIVNKQGWTAGLRFIPPGSDTTAAMGEVEMVIDKNDATYMSIPMCQVESAAAASVFAEAANILAAGRAGNISMTTSGISASTPNAK